MSPTCLATDLSVLLAPTVANQTDVTSAESLSILSGKKILQTGEFQVADSVSDLKLTCLQNLFWLIFPGLDFI